MSGSDILLSRGKHSDSVEWGFNLHFIVRQRVVISYQCINETCLNLNEKSQRFGAQPNVSEPREGDRSAHAPEHPWAVLGSPSWCFTITKSSVSYGDREMNSDTSESQERTVTKKSHSKKMGAPTSLHFTAPVESDTPQVRFYIFPLDSIATWIINSEPSIL